jgi:O-antigen ligase
MFALVPATGLLTSIVKGDGDGLLVGAFSVLVLVTLALSSGQSIRTVVECGIPLLVLVSIVLAALNDRFATIDRDFLPIIVNGRAFGLVGHPNMLGTLSGLAVLIGITMRRKGAAVTALIGVLGLLASASQTSILGAAVGVAIVLVRRIFTHLGRAIGLTAAVLAVVALILGNTLLDGVSRASTSFSGFDSTFTGRTLIWDFLLQQNFGTFGLTDAQFTALLANQFGLGSAHNLYVEVLTRYGYVGLFAAGLFVGWLCLRALFRGTDRIIAVTSLFLVASMTEGVLLAMPLVALFASLLGNQTQPIDTIDGFARRPTNTASTTEGMIGTSAVPALARRPFARRDTRRLENS